MPDETEVVDLAAAPVRLDEELHAVPGLQRELDGGLARRGEERDRVEPAAVDPQGGQAEAGALRPPAGERPGGASAERQKRPRPVVAELARHDHAPADRDDVGDLTRRRCLPRRQPQLRVERRDAQPAPAVDPA